MTVSQLSDCWIVELAITYLTPRRANKARRLFAWFLVVILFLFLLLFSTQSKVKKTVHGFPFKNYISKPRVDVAVINGNSNGCCCCFCCCWFVSLVFLSCREFKVLMDNFLANTQPSVVAVYMSFWPFGNDRLLPNDYCNSNAALTTTTTTTTSTATATVVDWSAVTCSGAFWSWPARQEILMNFDWLFLARTNGISIMP